MRGPYLVYNSTTDTQTLVDYYIINALLKHCNNKNRKNIFDKHCDYASLRYNHNDSKKMFSAQEKFSLAEKIIL